MEQQKKPLFSHLTPEKFADLAKIDRLYDKDLNHVPLKNLTLRPQTQEEFDAGLKQFIDSTNRTIAALEEESRKHKEEMFKTDFFKELVEKYGREGDNYDTDDYYDLFTRYCEDKLLQIRENKIQIMKPKTTQDYITETFTNIDLLENPQFVTEFFLCAEREGHIKLTVRQKQESFAKELQLYNGNEEVAKHICRYKELLNILK